MCEYLFFIRDRTNPTDAFKDARLYKAWDVITVQADGWKWSKAEQANPDWRILKVPGQPVSEGESFLGPQFNITSREPTQLLRRRAVSLDLRTAAASDPALAAWLADDKRAAPTFTMDRTKTLAAKVIKPRIADPAVIGDLATDIIG